MKLKNFAMITEEKVTVIFCIADDFCKIFDVRFRQAAAQEEGNH